MEQEVVKLRCHRIGCNATFTEDDNPEGSCQYHDALSSEEISQCGHVSLVPQIARQKTLRNIWTFKSLGYKRLILKDYDALFVQPFGPIFHDGMKEWSCCKKRSHDFTLFLEIPGCKTGKHTTEKPVLAKVTASPKKPIPPPTAATTTNLSSKESCPRCKQGFFCSDHGSQAKQAPLARSNVGTQGSSAPPKKVIDINEPQTCRNRGCGKTFKEKDNHETACCYHPGPAIFHDRLRGWKCCDIHVKEFDEFMSIPPCTKGWHNADPAS